MLRMLRNLDIFARIWRYQRVLYEFLSAIVVTSRTLNTLSVSISSVSSELQSTMERIELHFYIFFSFSFFS